MNIARLGAPQKEIHVVIVETAHGSISFLDARGVSSAIDGAFFAGGGIAQLNAAVDGGTLPVLAGAADLRVGSPINRPNNRVCIGMNYALRHTPQRWAQLRQLCRWFSSNPTTRQIASLVNAVGSVASADVGCQHQLPTIAKVGQRGDLPRVHHKRSDL